MNWTTSNSTTSQWKSRTGMSQTLTATRVSSITPRWLSAVRKYGTARRCWEREGVRRLGLGLEQEGAPLARIGLEERDDQRLEVRLRFLLPLARMGVEKLHEVVLESGHDHVRGHEPGPVPRGEL